MTETEEIAWVDRGRPEVARIKRKFVDVLLMAFIKQKRSFKDIARMIRINEMELRRRMSGWSELRLSDVSDVSYCLGVEIGIAAVGKDGERYEVHGLAS